MSAEARIYLYVGEKSKKYYTILLNLLKKEGHLFLLDSVGISEGTKRFLDANGYHWSLVKERESGRGDWVILPFDVTIGSFLKNPDTRSRIWVHHCNQGKKTLDYIQALKNNLSENNGVIEGRSIRLIILNSSSLYS